MDSPFRWWYATSQKNLTVQRLLPFATARLDDKDRMLLGLLADDTPEAMPIWKAAPPFAPAVHERVKRLRQHGVIKANVALLDGAKLGRPPLTFGHVDTTSWAVTRHLLALKELPR
ncbi:Lrp/AsnC family transcriptional regulator [Rhizobium tubonense]|uniref:Lrp/AsnC family transcriptional regulator n=1 Tax=Rhizobium tubonense TaxID=484088 RepID=UPI001FCED8A0|nr:hypothetical protein [Rhizobium tubonense]